MNQLQFYEDDKPEDIAFAVRMGYTEEEYYQKRQLTYKYDWEDKNARNDN